MGNCCVVCKNTNKKLKKKAREKQKLDGKLRRDNGDILNHVSQLSSQPNDSGHNGSSILSDKYKTYKHIRNVPNLNETNELLLKLYEKNTTTTTTTTITTPVINNDNCSDDNDSGLYECKNYRSLKKSKKSIKELEETLKNSCSIENWLNECESLTDQPLTSHKKNIHDDDDDDDHVVINDKEIVLVVEDGDMGTGSGGSSSSDVITSTSRSSSIVIDDVTKSSEDNDKLLNNLFDSYASNELMCEIRDLLYEINNESLINDLETQTKDELNKFLIPRSLSYCEDIEFLKWLFNNFDLNMYVPIRKQKLFTNDKLTHVHEINHLYLLTPLELNVKLIEKLNELDDQEIYDQEPSDTSNETKTNGIKIPKRSGNGKQHNYDLEYEYYRDSYKNDSIIRGRLRLATTSSSSSSQTTDDCNNNSNGVDKKSPSKRYFLSNIKSINSKSRFSFSPCNNQNAAVETTTNNRLSSVLNTPDSITSFQNDAYISYNELNERIFSCFLSNYSCKLADYFIKRSHEQNNETGYINKPSNSSQFSYTTITTNTTNSCKKSFNSHQTQQLNRLNLSANSNIFKFCIKLTSWPSNYEYTFFNRQRTQKQWPPKHLLNKIRKETCLLVNTKSSTTPIVNTPIAYYWTIDYSLAEIYLFKSLNNEQKFIYYLIYYITKETIYARGCNSSSNNDTDHMYMHHFFLFLEDNFDKIDIKTHKITQIIKLFLNYFEKIILDSYKTLNKPNYFDFNLCINECVDDCGSECLSISSINRLKENINNLQQQLNSSPLKTSSNGSSNSKLFYKWLNDDLNQLFSTKLHCQLAIYSKKAFLYEYIYEFTCSLYEQFRNKRDNFRINEELLIQMHQNIIKLCKSEIKNYDLLYEMCQNQSERDYILVRFEQYAEIVHKYLPQIRSFNQYLLFHYIWTVQVQYLAPFFNYFIDKYLNN